MTEQEAHARVVEVFTQFGQLLQEAENSNKQIVPSILFVSLCQIIKCFLMIQPPDSVFNNAMQALKIVFKDHGYLIQSEMFDKSIIN